MSDPDPTEALQTPYAGAMPWTLRLAEKQQDPGDDQDEPTDHGPS